MQQNRGKRAEIVIVCGPPGSGKSTYVQDNKWEGDLVWDWDKIMAAITDRPVYSQPPEGAMDFVLGMRERFCAIAAHCSTVARVWVIVSARCPLTTELQKLGAVILEMPTTIEECRERVLARGPQAEWALEQFLERTAYARP